jgi:hypothetical protein
MTQIPMATQIFADFFNIESSFQNFKLEKI